MTGHSSVFIVESVCSLHLKLNDGAISCSTMRVATILSERGETLRQWLIDTR